MLGPAPRTRVRNQPSPRDRLKPGGQQMAADSEGSARRKTGLEKIKQVYAGDVPTPPAGSSAFVDIMLETLFAEVWTREVLSMRDRRLLLLGAIAALGEQMTFSIQAKAAIKNAELTPEQLREVLVFLVHYVGYPRAAGLIASVEKAIQEGTAEV
jgi:4-carboxymuconolactone decarboxylase